MRQSPFSCWLEFFSDTKRKEKVHEMRADEGKESAIADDGCECVKSSAQINDH